MAIDEAFRVQIRTYLGYAEMWLQADPRLESAITQIQSRANGGDRPDDSAENQLRLLIQKCQDVDQKLDALDDMQGIGRMDDASFNPVREDARLRRKGRMYVYRMAKLLDTEPRGDVFGTSPAQGEDLRATAAYPAIGAAARARRAY